MRTTTTVSPTQVIPTRGVEELSPSTVGEHGQRLRETGSLPPIVCTEFDGYLLLLEGHQRVSAVLCSDVLVPLEASLLSAKECKKLRGSTPEQLLRSLSPSLLRDWEEAHGFRFPFELPAAVRARPSPGQCIVFAGPSGVGKNAIISGLLERNDNLRFVPSYTTRKRRPAETDGVDYHFVSRTTFERMQEERAFAEWQRVHLDYYGSSLEKLFSREEERLGVAALDVYGCLVLKSLYPEHLSTVYVDVPGVEVLYDRIQKRSRGKSETIGIRVRRAAHEKVFSVCFDHHITNLDLASAIASAESVVERAIDRTAPIPLQTPFQSPCRDLTYAVLLVEVDKRLLCWKNTSKTTPPLLILRRITKPADGLLLLVHLVVGQFQKDLPGEKEWWRVAKEAYRGVSESAPRSSSHVSRGSEGSITYHYLHMKLPSQPFANLLDGSQVFCFEDRATVLRELGLRIDPMGA